MQSVASIIADISVIISTNVKGAILVSIVIIATINIVATTVFFSIINIDVIIINVDIIIIIFSIVIITTITIVIITIKIIIVSSPTSPTAIAATIVTISVAIDFKANASSTPPHSPSSLSARLQVNHGSPKNPKP